MITSIKSLIDSITRRKWLYFTWCSFEFCDQELKNIKKFAIKAQNKGDIWVWVAPSDDIVRFTSFRELKPVTLWSTLNSKLFTARESRFYSALPRIKMPIDMLKLGLKLIPKESGVQGLLEGELALTIAREDFEPSVSGSDLLDCEYLMNEIQVEVADMELHLLRPSHFSWRYRHQYGFEFCLHNDDMDEVIAFVPLHNVKEQNEYN
ncbi:hypothetical protein C3I27_03835 [Campylobacter jejuni]|uniref:Uncharacterized protein n=1 Tax=Campylobacter jejuni TaxID=197 RepID=A0AAX1Z4U2_CAMJU|nr:hypothetical protein [Campylobacter jejuni]RTI48558.1 hypothetical protein C3I27_03835 [Campylobacter jejuni]